MQDFRFAIRQLLKTPGLALGAHRRDVFALIMRQGAMQTALAVGAGLLSLAAGRVLAKILYDVSPSDPLALVTATLMLAGAALLACFFPAIAPLA